MRIGELGSKYYEPGDDVIRVEVWGPALSRIPPRHVAILNLGGKEVAAELPEDIRRSGIRGRPETEAFRKFLRAHNLVMPVTPPPRESDGKPSRVYFVRQTTKSTLG